MPSKSSFQSVSCTSGTISRDKVTQEIISDDTYRSSASWFDTVTFGDSNPDWRQALREGRDATTTMTGSRSTSRVTSANLRFRKDIAYFDIWMKGAHHLGVAPPGADPATLDATNPNAHALGGFAQKVNQAATAVQGGVVLGELRQTLQMLRSPAQGLRRLVDDQRAVLARIRAQRRLGSILNHKKRIAENLADAWLEMQFGWRPFLSDVRSAHDALNIYTNGQSAYTRRITAKSSANVVGDESVSINGASFAYVYVHTRTDSHIDVIYRGALRVEGQHPGSMDPKLLGFSPKDFLPTAWELIPYSFLIDYFTNIGGIIYGMSNLFTRLSWCNCTTRKSYESHGWTTEYPQAGVTVTGAYAKVVTSKTSVSRAKYTGHGVPSLAFKLPSFGSLKWLNIAALVASRKSDRTWSFD